MPQPLYVATSNKSTMKKTGLLPGLLLLLVTAMLSCGKSDNGPYDKNIRGVNFTDYDAAPAGSTGTPDVHTYSTSFMMYVYPNPCVDLLRVGIIADNKTPLTLKASLVGALYQDAPANAVIANSDLAGKVVLTRSLHLDIATEDNSEPVGGITQAGAPVKGQHLSLEFNTSQVPSGFYRLYIESDQGDRYWDNVWVRH